jgi:hypothetical protein
MSSHLSEDQISRSFIGRATLKEEQHLQSCLQCRADLERLRTTCSLFRDAMKDLACRRIASGSLPRTATLSTPRRFVPLYWQWALVSAAVLLLVILPTYRNQKFQRSETQADETDARSMEVRTPSATSEDVLLMDAVTAHLARPIPAPMEGVMALLPRGETSAVQREATLKTKAPGGKQ